MTGTLAGAIGEGAGDTLAFLINEDDLMGEYVSPGGIRRNPYHDYPRTYSQWVADEVHADGEIYAAAMWRVYELYIAAGMTNDDVLATFVDGMNFTPAAPAPEDMTGDSVECFNCGRANPSWAQVCRSCGVPMRPGGAGSKPPAGRLPTDRDSLFSIGAALATIGVAIVFGLVLSGMYWLRRAWAELRNEVFVLPSRSLVIA